VSTHGEGRRGEDIAAVYLRLKGYKVLERNYRVPQGEIDLVCRKGDTIVFVEVKRRKTLSKGSPLEAVTSQKRSRLSAAGAVYLARHSGETLNARFDVVALSPSGNIFGIPRIQHLSNAFASEEGYNV
jgi:putative endonuclease